MMHALRTLFALSLLAMAPAHADTPQQRWVGDLPIMDGMTIEPELGFAFDSPSGRIVLVFAAATDSEAAILAYYADQPWMAGWWRQLEPWFGEPDAGTGGHVGRPAVAHQAEPELDRRWPPAQPHSQDGELA